MFLVTAMTSSSTPLSPSLDHRTLDSDLDDTSRLMLNALASTTGPMHSTISAVKLPFRRANAHDAFRLVFSKPCLLCLTQNSFTNVVEEMAKDDERESERIHPVDV